MKKIVLIITCIAAMQLASQGQIRNIQNNNLGWLMYFGDHKFSDNWGIHLEAQIRRNEIIMKPQQLLLRTGINYHLASNSFLTVGYCFVYTSQYGVFPAKCAFPENRFWEQLQLKNPVGRMEFITRMRLEQRFSKLPVIQESGEFVPGDDVYTNRGRLLVRISIPFKGKTIEDKSAYFSCYNEVFVNFGKNVQMNIFDQNRAYLAIGYKLPQWGKLEVGFMNQLLLKPDGVKVENNHALQLSFTSNLDFYKKKSKG